jgi:hypothetical protein
VISLAHVSKLVFPHASNFPEIFFIPSEDVKYKLPFSSLYFSLIHGHAGSIVPENVEKQPSLAQQS